MKAAQQLILSPAATLEHLCSNKCNNIRLIMLLYGCSFECYLLTCVMFGFALLPQMAELTHDFQYNLQLLAERDAELERYDTSSSQSNQLLAARAATITQLQAALADAQSGKATASVSCTPFCLPE
jgi:hypothetical protein